MSDQLLNIEGDGGLIREVTPVSLVDSNGTLIDALGGRLDAGNSTSIPLGSDQTFTGAWALNDDAHIAAGFFADEDGEFFIDISLDGSTILFSRRYDVVGGEAGRFDAFVKASRYHRVRFVNGSTAQSSLKVVTFTGNHLFPFSVSERDEPVGVSMAVSDISATTYRLLIDLSGRDNWPHNDVGRIDLYSANFGYDKASNTRGAIRLGVITAIDATEATVAFVLGVSFENSDLTKDTRDRVFDNPIKLGSSGGILTKYKTSGYRTISAINTATPLDIGDGTTATPAVGDIVLEFEHAAGGNYRGTFSCQYRGNASPT